MGGKGDDASRRQNLEGFVILGGTDYTERAWGG